MSRMKRLAKDKRGSATASVVGLMMVGTLVSAATLSTVQSSTEAYHLGETSVQAHSSLAAEAQNAQISLLNGSEAGVESLRVPLDALDREGVGQTHTSGYREHQASHLAGYDAAGRAMWVDRLGSQHHRFSQTAASGNMAMGLDNGTVWTWGQNNVYQLGTGDQADRHEPARVNTDVIFEELVEPTDTAACAIEKETRHLWCWGANEWEQLGDHDEVGEYLSTPAQVTDFPVAEGEKKVALTPNTLHVIDSSNRLRSQGENAAGENGDSVPFNTVLTNAQHVVADIHTALVVHSGGQLSSFTLSGLGASGQADAPTVAPAFSVTPSSGAVVVPAGQLAEDTGYLTPVRIAHPEGGAWRDIFIARNDADMFASTGYALDTSGQLWGWGGNVRGQVGIGSDDDIIAAPEKIETNIETMVASGSSAAALTTAGNVLTWGHSVGLGRSGDDTPASNGVSGARALSVSTGDRQAYCAITGSGTQCWGNDDHHQVMSDDINTVDTGRVQNYARVIHGDEFVCATDASLLTECWGRSELGETARGVTGLAHDPAPIARRGDHPVIYRGIHTGAQDYYNGQD